MAERLKIALKGKTFVVPEEVLYNQYFRINKILDEIKVSAKELVDLSNNSDSGLKIGMNVGIILSELLKQDKLPNFFAVLLLPEGAEIWEPKMEEDNVEFMRYIGDKTAVGVMTDFLSGRVDLILEIMSFFQSFTTGKNELLKNIETAKIKTDSTTSNPELV